MRTYDIEMTKQFRDFIQDCLRKHLDYETGALFDLYRAVDYEERISVIQSEIEEMKKCGFLVAGRDFRSSWEIPQDIVAFDEEDMALFLFIATYVRGRRVETYLEIEEYDGDVCKEYFRIKKGDD